MCIILHIHNSCSRVSISGGPIFQRCCWGNMQWESWLSNRVLIIASELSVSPPLPVRSGSCHEASPQLPYSALRKPRDCNHSSDIFSSRPLTICIALLWTLSNRFMSSSCCGTQLTPSSGGEVTQCRAEWDNPSPHAVVPQRTDGPLSKHLDSACHRSEPPHPFLRGFSPTSHPPLCA